MVATTVHQATEAVLRTARLVTAAATAAIAAVLLTVPHLRVEGITAHRPPVAVIPPVAAAMPVAVAAIREEATTRSNFCRVKVK
jgi:hypothetical protein